MNSWLRVALVFTGLNLGWWKLAGLIVFAAIVASISPSATAADSVTSRSQFNIKAQSLDGALADFAEQSGMQLLYDSELAAVRKSPGVKGTFTAKEALTRLLSDTHLVARFTGDKLATLVSTDNDATVIPLDTLHVEAQVLIGGRQSYERYARLLQAAVIDRVEKAEAAKFGQFRLALRLWVDGSGIVDRVALLGTTGDASTDLAIPDLMKNIQIGEPPPAGMPQPVRIRISARGVKE